jgi:hypothetical protein
MATRMGRLRNSGNLEALAQERRKQELLRPRVDHSPPATHNRRRSADGAGMGVFKLGMRQAQRQQELQARLRAYQDVIDGIGCMINPPQEPEPTVIVVQEGGDDGLLFNDLLRRRW